MAAILDISASVPEHRIKVFQNYVTRFQEEAGMSQRVAVRRCTVALIKSLRARTKTAKKKRPLKAFRKYQGPGPKWITPTNAKWYGIPLRRFEMDGFKKDKPHTFIYAAEDKRDAWQRHGGIKRHGLAKRSWGWFMKALFNRAEGSDGGGRLKIDGRMVEGGIREVVTGSNPRIEVNIINKMDYISEALSDADLSAAMSAANDSLLWQLNKAIEEAKK